VSQSEREKNKYIFIPIIRKLYIRRELDSLAFALACCCSLASSAAAAAYASVVGINCNRIDMIHLDYHT
jgi:hypothetical protein